MTRIIARCGGKTASGGWLPTCPGLQPRGRLQRERNNRQAITPAHDRARKGIRAGQFLVPDARPDAGPAGVAAGAPSPKPDVAAYSAAIIVAGGSSASMPSACR